jgi:hypothetical protein
MLFDNGSIFPPFQNFYLLGLVAFKFILILVESFWRFYKRQIFQYKAIPLGGKTELEIVLATLFDGEVLAVVVLMVRKDLTLLTIFILYNGGTN